MKPEYEQGRPLGMDDVDCTITCATAAATDALTALTEAGNALGRADYLALSVRLNAALDQLAVSIASVKACEPTCAWWADQASGDW